MKPVKTRRKLRKSWARTPSILSQTKSLVRSRTKSQRFPKKQKNLKQSHRKNLKQSHRKNLKQSHRKNLKQSHRKNLKQSRRLRKNRVHFGALPKASIRRSRIARTPTPYPVGFKMADPTLKLYNVTSCGAKASKKQFRRVKFLDEGGYGKVYKIQEVPSGKEYALKMLQESGEDGMHELNELDLLSSLRHPNILHLEYFFFNDQKEVGYVLPLAQASLRRYLKKNSNLDFETRVKWAFQFLDALSFLHKNNIFHCDIKPHNCLIIDNDLVVADFGFARENFGDIGTCTATPLFRSPQYVYSSMINEFDPRNREERAFVKSTNFDQYKSEGTFFSEDLWAVGATIFFLFTNHYYIRSDWDEHWQHMRAISNFLSSDIAENIADEIMFLFPEASEDDASDIGTIIEALLRPTAQERSFPVDVFLNMPIFTSRNMQPAKGTILQGDVVKPIDCSKVDVTDYIGDIANHLQNLRNSGRLSNDSSRIMEYVLYNAIDLFYRSFGAIVTKAEPYVVSAAYVLVSLKSVRVKIETSKMRLRLMELFELQGKPDLKEVLRLEREIVCTVGGILHRPLAYRNLSSIDRKRLLQLLENDCQAVSTKDADQIVRLLEKSSSSSSATASKTSGTASKTSGTASKTSTTASTTSSFRTSSNSLL